MCVASQEVLYRGNHDAKVLWHNHEAEYVAACMEGGLRNLLIEVFSHMDTYYRLGIDNQAAFVMATNPTYSCHTRHIELRWHYV